MTLRRAALTLSVAIAVPLLAAQQQPEVVVLERGRGHPHELAGAQKHVYRLALAAGEYAGVTVEQRGIDVVVQVLDSENKLIAEFDSESRTQGQERVELVSDSPVNYELTIKARYPKAPAASYEVRLVEVRPATEQDRLAFQTHKLITQALTLSDNGKYEESIRPAEQALALGEKAFGPDHAYVGYLLTKLALLDRTKGDYTSAEQLFQRAVKVNEKALGREHPQTATAIQGLGLLYMSINEYGKADSLFQEALDITERTLGKTHPTIVICLLDLSKLHYLRGDLERARSELEQALPIAQKTLEPDDRILIFVVHNLGLYYSLLGDIQHAEPLLERALTAIELKYGREHPYVCNPLENLGDIALQKKQYARALEFFSRAETVSERTLGLRHPDTANLLIHVANVYHSEGQYAKALELNRRALEAAEAAAGRYQRVTQDALANVARTYAAQGDFKQAVEYQKRYDAVLEKNLELNLAIGSEREKLAYLSSTSGPTDRTVSLHAREVPYDPVARDLAALVLLQRKGRVMDAMSGSVAALRQRLNAEDRKLFDNLGETSARLATLALGGRGGTPETEYQKQLAAVEEQREKFEAAISGRSAEFRAQSRPVTLAAVMAAIPPDAALIEFATYRPFDPKGEIEDEAYEPPHYIAYVLHQQTEVGWKDLGPAKEIDDALMVFREALGDGRRKDAQQLARAFDQRTMQPLRALIGDAKQLLISPDGELNLIPFEVLVDEQGRYLLERYSINYLTAGRDLLRMQVARESRNRPVVLADPFFGEPLIKLAARVDQPKTRSGGGRRSITTGQDLSSVYFARLPGTAEEARSIKSLFPDAEVLAGHRATKASLQRVTAPSILHIATHGFFLDDSSKAQPDRSGTRSMQANVKIENPLLRSGLALAGANLNRGGEDDGILTALEASNLNLWGTKVVTLSACETGVGEVKIGEGVYGLRRAFFLAGAETLVTSLWPVSDQVTREMMTAYYTGLKQGLGRGEALRQAQLAMLKRKDRQHPFYWASFIQSGEWKNLNGK